MAKVDFMKFILLICILVIVSSANNKHYKSYMPWETDSIFVAWLIKRHVDKNAVFSAVQKPEKIEKQFAINTANSDIRRSARFTAFEMAAYIYKIDNKCIDKLRPIIRILEMTPWRKHENMDAVHFEMEITPLFPKEKGQQSLEKVFAYIDEYCRKTK